MARYDASLVLRVPASSGAPQLVELAPIPIGGLAWTRDAGGAGTVEITSTVDVLDSQAHAALLDLTASPCELWLYRDAVQVHAGPLVNYRIDNRSITFTAPGLPAYLDYMKRTTDYDSAFLTPDQATIVVELIDAYQAQTYGHFGIDTGHVTATGTTRDLHLKGTDGKTLGAVITELGNADNGFDLLIDPASRRLELASPRTGVDRTATVFLNAGSIGKVAYAQSVGPDQIASDVQYTGASSYRVTFAGTASNPALQATFGRVMITAGGQDVESSFAADDRAARILADNDTALHTVSVDLLPVSGFAADDFDVRDQVTYDYDASLGQQTFTLRIKTIRVTLGRGTERLAVGFF